ncbi:uncharacterized protein LOC131041958 [Cryptomeria japonica]|uniref:uncharacterized protein LOC131041958 n=1 Tax=Cryptomeria japonica TaxID=3369 RepID=UPI0027DA2C28|nr:uncharacterized protein LOC131041958 [Cryptomeria japonica]
MGCLRDFKRSSLAGKGTFLAWQARYNLLFKIPGVIAKTIERIQRRFLCSENVEEPSHASLYDTENKVVKSWTVAFAFKAQYKLVTTAFVPAIGSVVTICVALMGAKVRRLWHHGNNVGLTFYVQCAFVIIGWIVIVYRWFNMLFSHQFSTNKMLSDVKRFTDRSFTVLSISIINVFERIPFPIVRAVVTIAHIVSKVLVSVYHISYFCWGLSACLVSLWDCLVKLNERKNEGLAATDKGGEEQSDKILRQMVVSRTIKYDREKKLNVTSYEPIEGLMKRAYKTSYEPIKDRLKKAEEEIGNCTELQRAIKSSKNVARFENKRLWKMRAVAIIEIMVLLRKNGCEMDIVDSKIKAYKQAVDLLEFLDCPENLTIDYMNLFGTCNFGAAAASLAADYYMLKIKRSPKVKDDKMLSEPSTERFKDVRQTLEKYRESPASSNETTT